MFNLWSWEIIFYLVPLCKIQLISIPHLRLDKPHTLQLPINYVWPVNIVLSLIRLVKIRLWLKLRQLGFSSAIIVDILSTRKQHNHLTSAVQSQNPVFLSLFEFWLRKKIPKIIQNIG